MAATKILVNVVKAEGILAKDKSGTSDPFAEVRYGKQIKKTPVIKKTLSPEWNAQLTLDRDRDIATLDVVLYDHDQGLLMGSSSEFLGSVTIPLSTIREEDPISDWFELEYNRKYQKKSEKVTGRVYLEVSLISSEDAAADAAAALARKKSDASASSGGSGGFFARSVGNVLSPLGRMKSDTTEAARSPPREDPAAAAAAVAAAGGQERAGRDVVKELVRVTAIRADGLIPRDAVGPVCTRPARGSARDGPTRAVGGLLRRRACPSRHIELYTAPAYVAACSPRK
jgi:hypothetical protein